MAVETYTFDEPLGLYSHQSHEHLAKGVIRASIRYADAIVASEPIEDFTYTELATVPAEEVHLGTIVESRDAHFGYALATSLKPEAVIGAYCLVQRDDEPQVKEHPKALQVARPETYHSNQDYQNMVEKLMLSFDKTELETIMRILGKITVSLEIAYELGTFDNQAFKKLGLAAQRQKEAEIKADKASLKRLSAVEPFTLYALHSQGITAESHPTKADQTAPTEIEHISEWTEFITAATDLLQHETDPIQTVSHVNIQHEINNKMYYMKLIANHGQLSGAQILCEDQTNAWKSQYFEIDSDKDEDSADVNMVSQMWHRPAILASLREGEVIDNETYEEYRFLAETSLRETRKESIQLVRPKDIKKRPAA